jgi:ATP/maltotriose-dependent transcriptional regulator MalT
LAVAEELGSEDLTAVLRCNCLGTMAMIRGDLAQAADLFRGSLPTLDRYASDYGAFSHRGMAELAMQTGEFEVAHAEFAVSERIGASGSHPYATAAGVAGRARVLAACGSVDRLEELRADALEAMAMPSGEFVATSVLADAATARLWARDVEGAREDFARALVTSGVTAQWERPRVLLGLARVAMTQGQHALAREHLDEVRTYVATHGLGLYEPELLLLDGRVAQVDGRGDDARMLLTEAARAAGEMGRRPTKAEALATFAVLQDEAGDAAEAASSSARARAVVDEMAGEILDEDLRRSFVASASEIFGGQPLIP